MEDWIQNKKEYRDYCLQDKTLPLFFQDWWLDMVCDGGTWDVCLSKDKGGNIQGCFPFYWSRSFGMKMIKMPSLTPYLGVWLVYPPKKEKLEALHRYQKKVILDLIQRLPGFAYYAQRHSPQLKNGLPFLWTGFKQSTCFSYELSYQENLDKIYDNFKGSVRTEIRKAQNDIEVLQSDDLRLFYALQEKSFARQSKKVPYTFELLTRIDRELKRRDQRKLLIGRDQKGNHHAGVYLVCDEKKVYNLLQGANPEFGGSGAIKLLLWEGIRLAHQGQKDFDFEGGMMANIEPVFSAFGGALKPHFKIYKGGNLLFRFLSAIRNS